VKKHSSFIMETLRLRFFYALSYGNVDEVSQILGEFPDAIHLENSMRQSALHLACFYRYPEIVRLLLLHPGINVNVTCKNGWTAFMEACYHNSVDCAKILLTDSRVDTTVVAESCITALSYTMTKRHTGIIKHWIASGKKLDFTIPWEFYISNETSPHFSDLARAYQNDPEGTRHQMRLELGWYDERASEIFAPVVFLSDGLLQGRTPLTPVFSMSTSAARFFEIASKLPQELQMILCYRAAGSMRTCIPAKIRELEFQNLAQWLHVTNKK
jgi:hypothetical protein